MILIIRDMKAQSEKEGPIESSNLRIIIWQIWRVFANCFFLFLLNSTQKWPTFIQKWANLALFSIVNTKTVIYNHFQACQICLTFWEIFKILFEGGSHFHSAVGRGTWQMMIAQVNRKWSCDEDGVHMSTKWLPIPRFLRKNEKLFLKRKLKTRNNWHFSGFALSPSLARTLSAPSWVPAGKSLSSKRK